MGIGQSARLTVRACDEDARELSADACDVEVLDARAVLGVADMTTLDELTEVSLIHTLRLRYARKEVYTSVGGIIIALNPYQRLPQLYDEAAMARTAHADAAGKRANVHDGTACV